MNKIKTALLPLLFLSFLLFPLPSLAYQVWFTYEPAHLPYTINMLPSTNAFSPWDEWMAVRWNNYASLFNRWIDRHTDEYQNGRNDQVDPFLTSAGFNTYFSTSGGWGTGAAVTFIENCVSCTNDTSDIAYNSATNWKTDKSAAGKLFQGSAIHELGHAIGIAHNFNGMSVMNYNHPDAIDDHLMPDDVRYVYDKFPTKAKVVTDMGVWAYHDNGYQSFAPATATPADVYRGGNLRLDGIYVGNLSNQSRSGAIIDVYLSTDTTISSYDTYLGHIWFGTWPRALGGRYDNFNFTVPANTAPGSYYVGMIIKADGSTQDSITYNNTAVFQNPVTVCTTGVPTVYNSGISVNSGVSYNVSWSGVTGATSYTICEATNSSFVGATCVNNGTSTSRYYTHTNCSPVTYYYRVRAETPCGSNSYSAAATKLINAEPLPAAPLINDPGNSVASGVSYTVTWESARAATSYSVCEATNSNFTGQACVNNGSLRSKSYLHTVSSNTFYYYRVRSNNSCGSSSYSTALSDMLVVAPCEMLDVMRSTSEASISFHSSIAAAYTASNSSGDSLRLHAIYFEENPNFAQNKSVILRGGYDCNYSARDKYSMIDGTATITSGQITFDRVIIQ